MNTLALIKKLMDVHNNLYTIKKHRLEDNIDIDAVTFAQYRIQDTMEEITGHLIEALDRNDTMKANIEFETYTTYIRGYDRTIVWKSVIVNGECLTDGIVGWYYGEPDEKLTNDYSHSNYFAVY